MVSSWPDLFRPSTSLFCKLKTWMPATSAGMTIKQTNNALEHRVGIGGLLRNLLAHVPVFDDLAVLELENVDDGGTAASGGRHVVDVHDDIVAVSEDALDLAVIVGKFLAQEGKEGLQPFRSVAGAGI